MKSQSVTLHKFYKSVLLFAHCREPEKFSNELRRNAKRFLRYSVDCFSISATQGYLRTFYNRCGNFSPRFYLFSIPAGTDRTYIIKPMRFIYLAIIIALISLTGCDGCGGGNEYEKLKAKEFDKLISKFDSPYSSLDTAYTEMYIAFKVCYDYLPARDTVIKKADFLLERIDVKDFRRHILAAKSIVYQLNHDMQKIWETHIQSLRCDPKDSVDATTSTALYYLKCKENASTSETIVDYINENRNDSAEYYINKAMEMGKRLVKSNVPDQRLESYVTLTTLLLAQAKENEAKALLKEFKQLETDKENINELDMMLDDFNYLKAMLEIDNIYDILSEKEIREMINQYIF